LWFNRSKMLNGRFRGGIAKVKISGIACTRQPSPQSCFVLWQAGPRSPTTSSASLQGTCTSKPRLYGAPLTALGRSEEKPPAKREWPRMNRLQHLLVPFQRAAPRNLRNRPKNSRTEFEKVLARIVRRYNVLQDSEHPCALKRPETEQSLASQSDAPGDPTPKILLGLHRPFPVRPAPNPSQRSCGAQHAFTYTVRELWIWSS